MSHSHEHDGGPGSGPLLERDGHLQAVADLIATVAGGSAAALRFVGPAGTGKTRLLAAAEDAAARAGMTVLRAHGDPLETGYPWGVAVQLLAPIVQRDDADELLDGAAARARPLLTHGTADLGPDADPFPLLHGLHWLVTDLAERTPTVLVVDDVHWADVQSLRLLRYLLRRVEDLPVGLVLAVRHGEPVDDEVDTLLGHLAADPAVDTHTVGPLTETSVGTIVRSRIGGATDAFCAAVARSVGGNPFLCHEVVQAVEAEGLPADDAGAARLTGLRPTGVRQSILLRLAHLGKEVSAAATAIAVLGPHASADVVGQVAALDPGTLPEALDRLVAAGLVVPGPPLAFAHHIVRDVVLDDMGPARRRHVHGIAARVLADRLVPAGEVVPHLLRADPVGEAWAVDLLLTAAASDRAAAAPRRAVELLRLAAATCPADRRVEVLTSLGECEVAAGVPDAWRRFEAADALDGRRDPRRAVLLGDALYAAGRFGDAADAFARGLDAMAGNGADDPVAEAMLLAGMDNAAMMGEPRPHRLQERAARLTSAPPEQPTLADRVLMATAAGRHAVAGDRPHHQVLALARAALGGVELPAVLGRMVLEPVTAALTISDAFEECRAVLDEVLDDARSRGELPAYAGLLPIRAVTLLRAGDLRTAAADAADALRLVDDLPGASRQGLATAHRVAALTALATDDVEAASAALDVPDATALWRDSPLFGWHLDATGRLHLRRGEHEAALTAFRAAGRVFSDAGGPGTFCPWRSGAALALDGLGREGEAREVAEEELALARAFGAPRGIAIALQVLARLRRSEPDQVMAALDEAASVLDGSQARLERARVDVARGAALRRAGQRRECRPVLRRGLEAARRCGATALAQQAADELAASGARRPDMAVSGVEALTPSELRVARMAVAGSTNRQIAEALFVTRKTVEVHLSSAYRKLAIAGRDELAAALSG